MAVSIISLNINGIRNSDKRLGLSQWLRSLSVVPDVVCLQQAHCVSDFECQSWFRSSGFLSVVSPGSNKSRGCIILYRPALSLVKSWSDDDGRLLQCEFVFLGKTFRVVSLYAPNRNPARDLFFDEVIPFVDPAIPTVLCGDLPLTSPGRVPLLLFICLIPAVSLTLGVIFTRLPLATLG